MKYNKLVASMSSLIQFFAAIVGSIREKQKWVLQGQGPLLTDILVRYVFELSRTCPNYWWKKVLPAYCHFKQTLIAYLALIFFYNNISQ